MSMSEAQLSQFRSRCLRASLKGYTIARAGKYAKTLGGSGHETSAEELLALCDAALTGKPAPKPAPAPKPKKALPPPPSVEEPEVEEAAAEVAPYEEWTKKELLAEAEARSLDVKGSMTKAELVEVLEGDDDE